MFKRRTCVRKRAHVVREKRRQNHLPHRGGFNDGRRARNALLTSEGRDPTAAAVNATNTADASAFQLAVENPPTVATKATPATMPGGAGGITRSKEEAEEGEGAEEGAEDACALRPTPNPAPRAITRATPVSTQQVRRPQARARALKREKPREPTRIL